MSYGPQQGGNLYYDLTPTGIPGLDEALTAASYVEEHTGDGGDRGRQDAYRVIIHY